MAGRRTEWMKGEPNTTVPNTSFAYSVNNLQKLRDGEPLGNYLSAEEEFAGLDGEGDFLN